MNAYERELLDAGKYAIYSKKAREDEYIQISLLLDNFAINEREISLTWRNILNEGVEKTTLENLEEAIAFEDYQGTEVLVEYIKTARDEGYEDIAKIFEWVSKISQHHEYVHRALADNIRTNQVFCRDTQLVWICLNCGNLIFDFCAPEICPVCYYPQGFYQINCDNF